MSNQKKTGFFKIFVNAEKSNESSGGYMSVDRVDAFQANWEIIRSITTTAATIVGTSNQVKAVNPVITVNPDIGLGQKKNK